MGYNAVGFGADDLRLPAAELVSVAADVNGKPSVFVSANVGLFGFDQNITQTSRIIKAGGMKIGVTAILGKQYQKEIDTPDPVADIEMSDPETALKKIVPELKRKADYLVLLANATQEEAIELAKKFPEFNVVVVAEGAELPPDKPETVPGTRTLLITVGHKGMNVIVLGLFDDAKQPVRYQRVPLDSRFPAVARDEAADGRLSGPVEDARVSPSWACGRCRIRWPRPTAASSARRSASRATRSRTTSGRRAGTPTPTRRWRSSIRRGTSIPSASVATSSAGTRPSSSRTRAVSRASRRRRT